MTTTTSICDFRPSTKSGSHIHSVREIVSDYYRNGTTLSKAEADWLADEYCRQIEAQMQAQEPPRPEPPKTKPNIDWSQVAPQFRYLKKNREGECYLFVKKPQVYLDFVSTPKNPVIDASAFVSCNPGTCAWEDSLVKRPRQFRISDDFDRTFVTRKGEHVKVMKNEGEGPYIAKGVAKPDSSWWYYYDNGHVFPKEESDDDIVSALE
jgi:hypothetical protein